LRFATIFNGNKTVTSPRQTAALIIDNVPLLMRLLRAKFREKRSSELSMAQFRTLAFVDANRGASLSEAAGHIGLSLPSMSRLVEGLVHQQLLTRTAHGVDRRRICLALTSAGKRELHEAYRNAESFFAAKFAELSREERSQLAESIDTLKRLFVLSPEGPS
jgi:DNA-binding MarR family transcriptional regulator